MKSVGAKITVKGDVQGVGFRWWALKQAQSRGVQGWVRNNRDGSVSVEAEGEQAAVESFIENLREGPPMAAVRDIDIAWQEYSGTYAGFDVKH